MRNARTPWLAAGALATMVGVAGCGTATSPARPQPTPPAVASTAHGTTPPPAAASPTTGVPVAPTASQTAPVTFEAVVDGDTIKTSQGTVRLIGIDAPERGECGHPEASTAIGRLLSAGDPVTLELPQGQNDRDQHGRLLRYGTTEAGVDLGLMQLQAGNAIARYDSTDGYPAHPRQAAYHAAQRVSPGPDGSVITIACQTDPQQSLAPFTGATATEDPWWRQYSSCAKLKKNTAGHPLGPFRQDDPTQAAIYDWFANGTGNRGDGDGDGLACE